MSDSELDVLRQRMSHLRSQIAAQAADMAADARRLTDWRYHFRKLPWLALGGAAALGFLAVPAKRRPGTAVDQEKIEALVRAIDPSLVTQRRGLSLGRMLFGSASSVLIKAGTAFAATQLAAWMESRAAVRHNMAPQDTDAAPRHPR